LRVNRYSYIYNDETVKTANEYGIYRLFNSEWDYTYKGEFKRGNFHGPSILAFANGHGYVGDFTFLVFKGRHRKVLANGDFLEGELVCFHGHLFESRMRRFTEYDIYVRANGDIYDVFKGTDGKLTIIRKASIIDIMAAVPLALCMVSLTSIGYFWDHKLRLLYPGVRPPAITRRKVGWEPKSLDEAIKSMNNLSWVYECLFAVGALTIGSLSTGVVSICALSVGALSIWGTSEVLVEVGHLSVTVAVKRVHSTFFLKK